MKIPDLYKNTAGNEPFKVPDGYFESLTDNIMEAVDASVKADARAAEGGAVSKSNTTGSSEGNAGGASATEPRKRIPFWKTEVYAKLKPYIYMAAMFGGLYFGVWVFRYQQRIIAERKEVVARKADNPAHGKDGASSDEVYDYINDACDFIMADSHDIMACVTGEDQ